ncbi:MAG: ribosome biogenesis GTPase Der [Chloroflexi bacterium]|nr:ribosome biogenesis GTPase Der [Chloroflexota bacterium]
MAIPTVAIVGRPNVGKSTLFNRLAGERIAIVADEPGTTRDWLATIVSRGERSILLVDTGGLLSGPKGEMERGVRAQVDTAVAEADVLLLLVDVTEGLVPGDREVADLLRSAGKPVILVANKADNTKREQMAPEFYALGMGEPVAVSAYHSLGMEDLWERVEQVLPPRQEERESAAGPRVAIIGRPNVGKSSLLNAVLGQERALVTPIPGTTRDAIDTVFHVGEKSYLLIDTAGVRRRGHVVPGIESFSVLRALHAIARADVAVLMVEAMEPMVDQDLHIAGMVREAYKSLVVVVSKWDLAHEAKMDRGSVEREVHARLPFFPGAPVIFTSVVTGEGVSQVLPAVDSVYAERQRHVSTSEVNRVLAEALGDHGPPAKGGRHVRFYYGTQASVDPPTFVFFTNFPQLIHFSYRRFLENRLRRAFGFRGTPLHLIFRGHEDAA